METRMMIELSANERNALRALSIIKRRSVNLQAAFIIRQELERQGYLEPLSHGRQNGAEETAPVPEPAN